MDGGDKPAAVRLSPRRHITTIVMPAQAGTQTSIIERAGRGRTQLLQRLLCASPFNLPPEHWAPAFAGVTIELDRTAMGQPEDDHVGVAPPPTGPRIFYARSPSVVALADPRAASTDATMDDALSPAVSYMRSGLS